MNKIIKLANKFEKILSKSAQPEEVDQSWEKDKRELERQLANMAAKINTDVGANVIEYAVQKVPSNLPPGDAKYWKFIVWVGATPEVKDPRDEKWQEASKRAMYEAKQMIPQWKEYFNRIIEVVLGYAA